MAVSDIPGAERVLLSANGLRFSAFAMGSGPVVLLLHGFPDGPETFRHQLPALAQAGFRAVAVTMRGYEPSSCPPDGSVGLSALAADVSGWIDALGGQPVHLVGHDWGASVAFGVARAYPQRLRSLSLLAVPNPVRFAEIMRTDRRQMLRSSYMMFFQLRGIADLWLGINHAALVERLWRRWSPGWNFPRDAIEPVRKRFRDANVRRTALDYYRQALRPDAKAAAQNAELLGGSVSVRTLGLVGERDGCIGADVFLASMRGEDFPAGLSVHRIADVGHFLHQERPDVVNRYLVNWFAGIPGQ